MFNRQDILDEVKRTAKENGGLPLSAKRFQNETGIIPYEWQKYWPRFGDVQREAGLKPNTFLKTPYKETFLYEKFIELMRELKKWPTKGEIVIKHNQDSKFPGERVFYNRLGLKPILASKVLEYSKVKKYNDIINICMGVLEEYDKGEESSSNNSEEQYGYVYLARSGKFYKIGRTNSMGRRHHEITIILPENLILIHEIKTDDPSGIEAYWHKRFELKRKNGEWFNLNSSEVRAFKNWKKIA